MYILLLKSLKQNQFHLIYFSWMIIKTVRMAGDLRVWLFFPLFPCVQRAVVTLEMVLTGRESLIRLIGRRRRFLPNRRSILSDPIPDPNPNPNPSPNPVLHRIFFNLFLCADVLSDTFSSFSFSGCRTTVAATRSKRRRTVPCLRPQPSRWWSQPHKLSSRYVCTLFTFIFLLTSMFL